MEMLEDTLSNSVQMTEVRACLAESMPAEMEQLMRMYVEPLKVKAERKRTGRAAIAGAMRTEFERAGVWGLMRKRIAAALYTRAGDPMKIDCGYQAEWGDSDVSGGVAGGGCGGGEGVGLFGSAVDARACSGWRARQLELTAVVEPLRAVSDAEDEAMERYRFGVEAMERQEIRVVTVSDLARVAETARVELRV